VRWPRQKTKSWDRAGRTLVGMDRTGWQDGLAEAVDRLPQRLLHAHLKPATIGCLARNPNSITSKVAAAAAAEAFDQSPPIGRSNTGGSI
jgi:hypothetical protein